MKRTHLLSVLMARETLRKAQNRAANGYSDILQNSLPQCCVNLFGSQALISETRTFLTSLDMQVIHRSSLTYSGLGRGHGIHSLPVSLLSSWIGVWHS